MSVLADCTKNRSTMKTVQIDSLVTQEFQKMPEILYYSLVLLHWRRNDLAQWIKHLLHKYGDQSLPHQTQVKLGMVTHIHNQ